MAFDLNGYAWVAQSDSGIAVLKITTNEWVRHYTYGSTNHIIPQGYINAVTTNNHSIRWFGSTQGLIRLSDSTFTKFTTSTTAELPSNYITSLAYDLFGNLWIGTTKGVAVYNPDGTRFGN